MYSAIVAIISDGLVEIPYILAQSIISLNIVYWTIGFSTRFQDYAIFLSTFFIFINVMTYLGMLLALLTADPFTGVVMGNIVVTLFLLSAGITVPYTDLPTFFKFFFHISPIRMCQENMITAQFTNDYTIICNPQGIPIAGNNQNCSTDGTKNSPETGEQAFAREYVLNEFLKGYSIDDQLVNILYLLIWLFALRFLGALALIYIKHHKR